MYIFAFYNESVCILFDIIGSLKFVELASYSTV